ncbi:hypothetical protein MKW98_014568 [Papaver atlanticum]|uniref:Uncharacterized protein n=1 Tax=Papaver atlanticum TaxID=357466 RepID=A0AAD4SF29_9MAGN|nr:hypothetical protein MKW98_014568 [Papaver atlanticum]
MVGATTTVLALSLSSAFFFTRTDLDQPRGKSWLSITMLSLMGTLRSTGRIMSRHGLTSLPARPEDVLQDKRRR